MNDMEHTDFPTGLSFKQARRWIADTAQAHFRSKPQVLPLGRALGRVLAAKVVSRVDVPGFDNAAMDGYAIRYADAGAQGEGWFDLLSPNFAGDEAGIMDKSRQAVPIMTGAPLPLGADTVVPRENAEVKDNRVYLRDISSKRQFVRARAEDVRRGQMVLPAGHRLRPQDLGLIASVGCAKVAVHSPPAVTVFTGGDEIIQPDQLPPGQPLPVGKIFDSVRYTLGGLLQQCGCRLTIGHPLPDDASAVAQALTTAAAGSQVIITTGGVSAGDRDYIRDVLREHGQVLFHKVRMKPGFPFMLAELNGALVFALPGNPVSSFTTFGQLVLPALRLLEGETSRETPVWRAEIDQKFSKSHYRREFVRGRLRHDAGTGLVVSVCGNQSSGRLSSVAEANCFIVLDETPCDLQPGDQVNVQRFCDIFYPDASD